LWRWTIFSSHGEKAAIFSTFGHWQNWRVGAWIVCVLIWQRSYFPHQAAPPKKAQGRLPSQMEQSQVHSIHSYLIFHPYLSSFHILLKYARDKLKLPLNYQEKVDDEQEKVKKEL
jgi:hypothetical protein